MAIGFNLTGWVLRDLEEPSSRVFDVVKGRTTFLQSWEEESKSKSSESQPRNYAINRHGRARLIPKTRHSENAMSQVQLVSRGAVR